MHITPYYIYYGNTSRATLVTEAILPLMTDLKRFNDTLKWAIWFEEYKGSYLGLAIKSPLPLPNIIDTTIQNYIEDYMKRNPSPDMAEIDTETLFMDFSNNQLLRNNYQYTEDELDKLFSCLDHSTVQYSLATGELLGNVDEWHYDIGLEKSFACLCILVESLYNSINMDMHTIIDQLTQLHISHCRIDVHGAKYPAFMSESDLLYQKLAPALDEMALSARTLKNDEDIRCNSQLVLLHSLIERDITEMQSDFEQSIAHVFKVYRLICLVLGQKVLSGLFMLLWIKKLQSTMVPA